MTNQIIKEQISQLIESIIEQTETILKHPDKIPQIELDIALSYMRELYKKFNDLDKLNYRIPDFEKIIPESLKKEIQKELPKTETRIEKGKIVEPEPLVKAAPVIEETIIEKESPIKEIKPEPQPSLNLFFESSSHKERKVNKENKKSIFEKAAENKPERRIADKIHSQPIGSMKSAIGINEKFLFINELFKGNMHEYNAFITKLDGLSSLNDAVIFINQLKENHGWKEDSQSMKKLADLIERRYSS